MANDQRKGDAEGSFFKPAGQAAERSEAAASTPTFRMAIQNGRPSEWRTLITINIVCQWSKQNECDVKFAFVNITNFINL